MMCEYAIVICPKTSKPCDHVNCMQDCAKSKILSDNHATFADCFRIYSSRTDISPRRKTGVISTVRRALSFIGLDEAAHVDSMTYRRFKELISILENPARVGRQLSKSYIQGVISDFGALGAEETRDYYEEEGFCRPMFDTPVYRVPHKEVKGMTAEQELLVEQWMFKLSSSKSIVERNIFVALWFERLFAVRPNDINRLTWDCIKEENGRHFLRYTPNKTKKLSDRKSNIVINSKFFKWIEPFIRPGEPLLIKSRRGRKTSSSNYENCFESVWRRINHQYRIWGICDTAMRGKASYINRRQRITEAFDKDGFKGSCAIGMNTPQVQFKNYIISGEYSA